MHQERQTFLWVNIGWIRYWIVSSYTLYKIPISITCWVTTDLLPVKSPCLQILESHTSFLRRNSASVIAGGKTCHLIDWYNLYSDDEMMLICDLWQLLYILCLIFINLGDAVMVISILSWVAAVVPGVVSQLQRLKYKYVFILQCSALQNHHITIIPPVRPLIRLYLLSQEKSGLFLLFLFLCLELIIKRSAASLYNITTIWWFC